MLSPPTGGFVDWFGHMTLPAVAMALGLVGIYSRYVRSSMVTALREPHVAVGRVGDETAERRLLRLVEAVAEKVDRRDQDDRLREHRGSRNEDKAGRAR